MARWEFAVFRLPPVKYEWMDRFLADLEKEPEAHEAFLVLSEKKCFFLVSMETPLWHYPTPQGGFFRHRNIGPAVTHCQGWGGSGQ